MILTEWWFYVLIMGAILLIAVALIWWMGAQSQQPRKVPNEREPEIAAEWNPLVFESSGLTIEGWLIRPSNLNNDTRGLTPLVVVAHGWGSNRSRVLRYAKPLYESGYAVLMFDARSHGESESIKAPSALMFRDDVIAAVKEARKLTGIDPQRIAVLGHSMGGFGALLAMAEGLRVNAIITDSMPVHFDTMMEAELKRKKLPLFPLAYLIPTIWLLRANISRAQFRNAHIPSILRKYAGPVADNKQPVLMIHSHGDTFITSEELRSLSSEMPEGTIQTIFVNTEGHSASEQDSTFWEAVLPFLAQSFSTKSNRSTT
ncbi:alpha/beta hydrolase [Paenibacillus sp. L3-i20]|uniref:alpha/beta hydrolase n=1 Tax=Paenibacillus sp. L3-i20 TaxID=2905833 RepID=UPI001EDD9F35|nr:alpha/beta fold hydrolase [Paenibacillus sp. L3-i20]GKU80420.1 alpha/beta hydrolase [Paenibacillus sp. L3-i20]